VVLLGRSWPFGAPDHGLDPFSERTPREEHPPATDLASESDVSSDAYDAPLVASTRVRLAQPYQIVHLNVLGHLAFLRAVQCDPATRLVASRNAQAFELARPLDSTLLNVSGRLVMIRSTPNCINSCILAGSSTVQALSRKPRSLVR
jgi:hypothetical protein